MHGRERTDRFGDGRREKEKEVSWMKEKGEIFYKA